MAIDNLERRFAGVAVAIGDAMKFRIVDFGSCLQGAKNYRPSNLQCAQIALGESVSGKVNGGDWQLVVR